MRRHAAFWATWTAAVDDVKKELGFSTVNDLLDAVPNLTAQLTAAREGLAAQGMSLSVGASLASALRQHYPQRLLVEQVQKKLQAALKQSLSPSRAAELGGAGGPGASGFLQYPTDANCPMENTF